MDKIVTHYTTQNGGNIVIRTPHDRTELNQDTGKTRTVKLLTKENVWITHPTSLFINLTTMDVIKFASPYSFNGCRQSVVRHGRYFREFTNIPIMIEEWEEIKRNLANYKKNKQ
jgi:hypothetical protein